MTETRADSGGSRGNPDENPDGIRRENRLISDGNPLVPQQPRLPVNCMMIYVKMNPPAEHRQKQHGQPAQKAVKALSSPDNAKKLQQTAETRKNPGTD